MTTIVSGRSLPPLRKETVPHKHALKILLAIGTPGRERIAFNDRGGDEALHLENRHGARRTRKGMHPRFVKSSDTMEEQRLRIFYLKKKIIFPFCTLAVFLRPSEESGDIKKGDWIIALTVRSIFDLLFHRKRVATLCEVMDVTTDNSMVKFMLRGIERVRIEKIIKRKHAIYTRIEQGHVEHYDPSIEDLRKKSQELIFLLNVEESDKLIKMLNYIVDLNQMTDFISNYFIMGFGKRYRIYKETQLDRRSALLTGTLTRLIHTMNVRGKKKTA